MGHGSSVLGLVILLLLVCGVAVVTLRKKQTVNAAWPVYARPVMSEVERQLFRRLVEAFPEKLILPQVQLCRFVEVQNVRGRLAILNRYNRLSADLLSVMRTQRSSASWNSTTDRTTGTSREVEMPRKMGY